MFASSAADNECIFCSAQGQAAATGAAAAPQTKPANSKEQADQIRLKIEGQDDNWEDGTNTRKADLIGRRVYVIDSGKGMVEFEVKREELTAGGHMVKYDSGESSLTQLKYRLQRKGSEFKIQSTVAQNMIVDEIKDMEMQVPKLCADVPCLNQYCLPIAGRGIMFLPVQVAAENAIPRVADSSSAAAERVPSKIDLAIEQSQAVRELSVFVDKALGFCLNTKRTAGGLASESLLEVDAKRADVAEEKLKQVQEQLEKAEAEKKLRDESPLDDGEKDQLRADVSDATNRAIVAEDKLQESTKSLRAAEAKLKKQLRAAEMKRKKESRPDGGLEGAADSGQSQTLEDAQSDVKELQEQLEEFETKEQDATKRAIDAEEKLLQAEKKLKESRPVEEAPSSEHGQALDDAWSDIKELQEQLEEHEAKEQSVRTELEASKDELRASKDDFEKKSSEWDEQRKDYEDKLESMGEEIGELREAAVENAEKSAAASGGDGAASSAELEAATAELREQLDAAENTSLEFEGAKCCNLHVKQSSSLDFACALI